MTTQEVPQRIRTLSKHLSWLLRHGAGEVGLPMDPAGWASIDDVLRQTNMDQATLMQVVATNTKNRIEVHEDRLRACQGHSNTNMPVQLEALEASWTPFTAENETVVHGTALEALPGIAAQSLLPVARTHVHLALHAQSTVGKRSKVQVLLIVSTEAMQHAGARLWCAPNGVILTRAVPPGCIVGVVPQSKKARASQRRDDGPLPWLAGTESEK